MTRSYGFVILLFLACVVVDGKYCGTYMSPCISYINKVYQLIGTTEGPALELITNLNFYASDMCIGSASSFITHANLTKESSDGRCHKGFQAYIVHYDQLHFVVHNRTLLELYNISCDRDFEENHLYNILEDEIECFQDGKSFFSLYKDHVPATQQHCFAIGDDDFLDKPDGTRNILMSTSGCTDLDEGDQEL